MSEYIDWPGNEGPHRLWFVSPNILNGGQPGVYMFTMPLNGGWWPVYVGKADDLAVRLAGHEMWLPACANGATRVMASVIRDAATRAAKEQDLISYWNPICNTQHRTAGPVLKLK